MNRSLVIGVAGGSGSGKSTLCRLIAQAFPGETVLLNQDDYYLSHPCLSEKEKEALNYDHPNAFETSLLVEQICQLKAGQAVECPVYDFTAHDRFTQTRLVQPKPILLVDGMLVLADPALCAELDLRIFVEADEDIRLIRRIRRDMGERGRSLESILAQYECTVKPMYQLFVEPSKKNADLLVPEGGQNQQALEEILCRIKQLLQEKPQKT